MVQETWPMVFQLSTNRSESPCSRFHGVQPLLGVEHGLSLRARTVAVFQIAFPDRYGAVDPCCVDPSSKETRGGCSTSEQPNRA